MIGSNAKCKEQKGAAAGVVETNRWHVLRVIVAELQLSIECSRRSVLAVFIVEVVLLLLEVTPRS